MWVKQISGALCLFLTAAVGAAEIAKTSSIEVNNPRGVEPFSVSHPTTDSLGSSFSKTLNIDLIRFKILGFNDFHGALESRTLYGRPVGGAAVLAAYFAAEEQQAEKGAILVHAGDLVGASPPISALLQDEPTIHFLNQLASQACRGNPSSNKPSLLNQHCNIVATLGNHEFDDGVDEMLRLMRGGMYLGHSDQRRAYAGANFPYVSANVKYQATGKLILPPYTIIDVGGVKVAFIGAVLQQTPSIVAHRDITSLSFSDEAKAINHYARLLKRQGIRALVVSLHQGTQRSAFSGSTATALKPLEGPAGEIVHLLDDEIDIVISGHAHGFTNQFVSNQNGKVILVTQAYSSGMAYADIDVTLDKRSGDIVAKTAEIITTWADSGPGLAPRGDVAAMVASAAKRVAPLVSRRVGRAAVAISRAASPAGESALGNLIADAHRVAMASDIAFTNPGGIRGDIAAGDVTWGALFEVQPFGNDLVRMDMTGRQIINLLNAQWGGANTQTPRVLQVSGIVYSWQARIPAGKRIDVNRVLIGAKPLDLNAVYSVTVNSFMASGGDHFSEFTAGRNRVLGPKDLDALVSYIGTLPQPFSASISGRIKRNKLM